MSASVAASVVSKQNSISNSTLKSKISVFSSKSHGSSLGTSTAAVASLKMERNLLERMVQERDEKISSLQKSIEVQNEHVNKLQAKIEISERREKQIDQRHKLKLENLTHEKSMLKSQLKVMHDEIRRISDDPIHHALATNNSTANSDSHSASGGSTEEQVMAQIMPAGNPFGAEVEQNPTRQEKVKLANSAQGVLLQSQLYQAMNSLKQLRQQTGAMKKNYDEIVTSLQQDFVSATDEKARIESELLSQLSLLEQDRKIAVKALEDQLVQKDARIRRLEKRMRSMDDIMDEELSEGDDSESRQLSFNSIGADSLGAKSLGDANFTYRTQFQNKSGLGKSELKNPYSMTTSDPYSTPSRNSASSSTGPTTFNSVFRERANLTNAKPRANHSAASLLLQQSQERANKLLQRTAAMRKQNSVRRHSTNSIMVYPLINEEETSSDNDDAHDDAQSVRSHQTATSEAASVASNLLQESRARAMKLLAKTAPTPPADITQVLSTESDDIITNDSEDDEDYFLK
mmetsp:Transcript_19264/g.28481  ORF Transcript_19264/g.28481 Transcript_19264/m.28481 type:complete len:518 (+) Transcript_19264:347-1900(+)